MFGLKPCAESAVIDFGLTLPEIGREIALNLKVIQLQLNELSIAGEVTMNVACSDMQSSDAMPFALCGDYHGCLLCEVG
jgi:hypothetical protein